MNHEHNFASATLAPLAITIAAPCEAVTPLSAETALHIGKPIYCSARGIGYITDAQAPKHKVSMLTRGGMIDVYLEFECTFSDTIDTIADLAINDLIDAAKRQHLPDCENVAAWRARSIDIRAKKRAQREQAFTESQAIEAAFVAEARAKMPAGTKAIIVARLKEDASDYSSDYHNSRVLRTVIIGWSMHTRDLFGEMRKAALNLAETAHLHDASSDSEHREKYSMGAGFYLKDGYRDQTGWHVEKLAIYGERFPVNHAEWSLSEPVAPPLADTPAQSCGEGSFKSSGTGVSTVLVVIDKDSAP